MFRNFSKILPAVCPRHIFADWVAGTRVKSGAAAGVLLLLR